MKYKHLILSLSLVLVAAVNANGQIGKFLKEKAKNIDLNKVKDLASDAIDKEREKLDSTSFSYAISINDNADFYEADSKSDQALKLVSNLKSADKTTEAEQARKLLDIGEVLYAKGHYKKAGVTFESARAKYEHEGLTNDPNYFKVISNLGLLYSTMGRYTKAEEHTLEALNLRKEAFGDDHSSMGASLNNLAVLQKETGKYNEAEENLKQTINILTNAFGRKSMPVAIALNNEAMLYQDMGRYEQADETLKRAIAISGELQNEKSNNHQKFLTNQALLYQTMGRYEESESIFKQIIKLKQRLFGSNHPDYAHMLSNLAALYVEMGKLDEVEDLLKEAIEIYEDNFGVEHRHYATATNYLGNFYRYKERYDEAKPLLLQAVRINEEVLGENHPDYAQSKEDLAILYWKTGEFAEAELLYKEAMAKSVSFINNYFPPMSEAEKTKYWDKLRPRFERFYSFAVAAASNDPDIMSDVYDIQIATKGLLLNATNKIKRKILSSNDQELIDQYLRWIDQKEMLAQYYSYSKEELAEQQINLDSLEEAANYTEKRLSEKSQIFQEGYNFQPAKFNEVTQKLKPNEAAVEIARFRKFDQSLTNEAQYLVLVLNQNSDRPTYTLIENGNQLEDRYYKYYNNVIHQKMQDDYSYDQYWAKIAPLVAGKSHLFVSVDGIYSQINLNTLSKSPGQYLLSQHDITLIGNSKEIVEKEETSTSSKTAFLIGNPDFGGNEVAPLPGTKVEIAAVSKMLLASGYRTSSNLSADATEANIKSVNSPKILHIATHGYFLKDVQLSKGKVFGISSESAKDNPLLRSGLLFAGAGNVLDEETNTALESSNNGILTAFEAMNLTLSGTDLVILSACETAVGDVKAGEGVYGLQRAFRSAGADALLMSLWKVDDAATQELMTNFYSRWLRNGNKKAAFKEAQLAMKTKYKDPYYWGAFVLVGE